VLTIFVDINVVHTGLGARITFFSKMFGT